MLCYCSILAFEAMVQTNQKSHLVAFLVLAEFLSQVGVVKVESFLLETAVEQHMDHLALLDLLQTETDQLLEAVHVVLIRAEERSLNRGD